MPCHALAAWEPQRLTHRASGRGLRLRHMPERVEDRLLLVDLPRFAQRSRRLCRRLSFLCDAHRLASHQRHRALEPMVAGEAQPGQASTAAGCAGGRTAEDRRVGGARMEARSGSIALARARSASVRTPEYRMREGACQRAWVCARPAAVTHADGWAAYEAVETCIIESPNTSRIA